MSKRKSIPKMTPLTPAPAPTPIEELLDPNRKAAESPSKSVENNRKTEKQNSVMPEKRKKMTSPAAPAPEKPAVKPAAPPAEPERLKSKCTYYIPTELAERVDMAHARSRTLTRGSRYKASKSELIEAALNYALDEIDRNGEDSDVIRRLRLLIGRKS